MHRQRFLKFVHLMTASMIAVYLVGCQGGSEGEKAAGQKAGATTPDSVSNNGATADTGKGSAKGTDDSAQHKAAKSSPSDDTQVADAAGAADLKTVDRKAYDQTIESHLGKVVLADFWFTL